MYTNAIIKEHTAGIFLFKHVLEVFPYQGTCLPHSLVAVSCSTSIVYVSCAVNQFPTNVLGCPRSPVHPQVWELERHFPCHFSAPLYCHLYWPLGCILASLLPTPVSYLCFSCLLTFSSGKACLFSCYFLSSHCQLLLTDVVLSMPPLLSKLDVEGYSQ